MIADEDALAVVLHGSCGEPTSWRECDNWYRHTVDSRNVGYFLRYAQLESVL